MKILITGATGNVGRAIINNFGYNPKLEILAGIRNIKQSQEFISQEKVTPVLFDFENSTTVEAALDKTDMVFFMRPPHLADVKNIFKPFISKMQEKRISYLVFLSVQGAEKNKRIPHYKIERLIRNSGIPYSIIRSSYFMQNLTTTLRTDLIRKKRIFLPSGGALFNWIDVHDIAKVTDRLFNFPSNHLNRTYTLTGSQNHSFYYVAHRITKITGIPMEYNNPGLLEYIIEKRKEKMSWNMIIVMLMLHYLPQWKSPPKISQDYYLITGDQPTNLNAFIEREITHLMNNNYVYV